MSLPTFGSMFTYDVIDDDYTNKLLYFKVVLLKDLSESLPKGLKVDIAEFDGFNGTITFKNFPSPQWENIPVYDDGAVYGTVKL